ncbi:hypothetical protein [Acinetobacter baumannii]|uniref:hypothetical protein n=1 Tax=Acinetobacter baumannii TaxID=470 RepID=UPI0027421500|nr:hypothetical protein [Acinetobacter baumannii]MDP7763625.1 hypothetical protein [Acinetobacter baumannii]
MTDLNKEREAFELFELNKRPCATPASLFERFDSNDLGEDEQHYVGRYVDSYMQEKWELWQKAKAQAVPDTHVLVEKSKINKWYQDANEPESFSNDDSEDGLRSLGGLIDDYGIMEVEIHESALINTKKAFGVWKSKSPTDICTNFVLVETLEEAEKILANNKAMYESESGAE